MLRYALKRIALLPPSLILISLILFGVLNLAPARPGLPSQMLGGRGQARQGESLRAFREQFDLDKPILLNTRFALSESRVRDLLQKAHGLDSAGRRNAHTRVAAQHELEELGNYTVRHLIPLLQDPDPSLQRAAASQLTQAAQLRFHKERGSAPHTRATNRQIAAANATVREFAWTPDARPERVRAIKARWMDWWQKNRERFEYSRAERLRMLFLETRFASYWTNLLHLDFGRSNLDRRPILPTIAQKLRYSLSLTTLALMLSYLIAVPLGIWSALRRGTRPDTLVTGALFALYSLPTFFVGTLALRLLSAGEPVAWFPPGGFETMDGASRSTLARLRDIAWHLALPVATYAAASLAALSRYARAGVLEVIRADYVRTARAKGLPEAVVVVRHVARNGMLPILTLLDGLLPTLVSGSVVIEVVFNLPGMGLYLYDSINLRDYNAVMGVLMMASFLTLLGMLISDLLYGWADPRIRYERV